MQGHSRFLLCDVQTKFNLQRFLWKLKLVGGSACTFRWIFTSAWRKVIKLRGNKILCFGTLETIFSRGNEILCFGTLETIFSRGNEILCFGTLETIFSLFF